MYVFDPHYDFVTNTYKLCTDIVLLYVYLNISLCLPSEDASDTRKLLGDDSSHSNGYGSAPFLDQRQKRTRRLGEHLHFSWPDFNRILELAAFWKRWKLVSPNRRIDINNPTESSHKFCSNRIR